MPQLESVEIPNRSLFRQPEVCEIARIQPYVLRSWEAEFPDLGVTKRDGGPRVYRRADVERVLRLKHLLFVEGLTLAGARRKLGEEQAGPSEEPGLTDLAELLGSDARERILQVKHALRELAALLARAPGATNGEGEFRLQPLDPVPPKAKPKPSSKPAKSAAPALRGTAAGKGVTRKTSAAGRARPR